jgi:hypothetical protein
MTTDPQLQIPPGTERTDRMTVDWDYGKLINELHGKMAELRDELIAKGAWSVPAVDCSVSLAMLDNACKPNGRLLDWSVYQTLQEMAEISNSSRVAYRTRLLHRMLVSLKNAETATDSPRPVRRAEMSQLQRQLATITTETGLMDYLRHLKSEKEWSLRKIVAQLELHHRQDTSSSSCLSDWFKMDQLPRSRSRFEALISVLLPDYPDAPPGTALHLIMARYDDLLAGNLPAGNLVADRPTPAEVDEAAEHWRAKYTEVERALRYVTQRLQEADLLIAEQKITMARLRGDYTVHLSRAITV